MFANSEELRASFTTSEEELRVFDSAVVWSMEPERAFPRS
jgi:hypothetical protein